MMLSVIGSGLPETSSTMRDDTEAYCREAESVIWDAYPLATELALDATLDATELADDAWLPWTARTRGTTAKSVLCIL